MVLAVEKDTNKIGLIKNKNDFAACQMYSYNSLLPFINSSIFCLAPTTDFVYLIFSSEKQENLNLKS